MREVLGLDPVQTELFAEPLETGVCRTLMSTRLARFLDQVISAELKNHFNSKAMALTEYKKKRKFDKTPEPGPEEKRTKTGRMFVIQKHRATALALRLSS